MHIGAQGRYELQRYTFTPLKKSLRCDAQKENFPSNLRGQNR